MLLEIFYLFCMLLGIALLFPFAAWCIKVDDRLDEQREAKAEPKQYEIVGYIVKQVK